MSAERKILSGVVADDLTGATTTGALLAARGVKNIVSLSDTSSLSYDDVDALLGLRTVYWTLSLKTA